MSYSLTSSAQSAWKKPSVWIRTRIHLVTSASVPKKNKSSKSSNGKGKSYIRNEDSPSGTGTKNCIYHGMNNTHSTDECKDMQAMAESKKSSSGNTNNSSSYADKKKGNDKSYDKSVTKKEINALVAKTVRKELR